MAFRRSSLGVLTLMLISASLFLGLAARGWGSWSGLVAHPARAGACLVVVLSTIVATFSRINLRGFRRPDSRGRWVLAPAARIALTMTWFPAHADRRDLWVLDGDAVRYLGLDQLTIGGVLRVGPMFDLGRRFIWPL